MIKIIFFKPLPVINQDFHISNALKNCYNPTKDYQ